MVALQQHVRPSGVACHHAQGEEMLRQADLDGDGHVNMDDFCAMNNVAV